MQDSSKSIHRTRILVLYGILAFALSWVVEIPLALKAQGWISSDVPFFLHYLAAFGPFIAGLVVTQLEQGSAGLVDLFRRMVKWNVRPVYWAVALSPLLLFILVSVLMRVIGGSWLDPGILSRFDFLPDIGVWVVFIWLSTYGFGEETGWRGVLLPRLQQKWSAGKSTLILWAVWALWHTPTFFYLGTAPSIGMLIGFLVGVLAGAIFLTWLYNSTQGSILVVAVWHGLFDYVTACQECKTGVIAATVSTLVMIWAIAVVWLFKWVNLSPEQRQEI